MTPIALEAAIAALTAPRLLDFLARQRWFGAKGEVPSRASVADWMTVPSDAGGFAITRVRVETSRGDVVYQVPIAVRDARPVEIPDGALIVRDESLTVYDAVYDPAFRAVLARGVAEGLETTGPAGHRWIVDAVGDRIGAAPSTRLVSAEQSNTSIMIGDTAIVKLFRRLAAGMHPDVEVARFLSRAGFTNTPAFLGALRFENDHGSTIAGMTQQFVPGAIDLWAYTLDRGRAYFGAPVDRDAPNDLVSDAARLGAATRAMHAALSSGADDAAFAPEPVSPDDVDRWASRTQQAMRDALTLLERQLDAATLPRERDAEARALLRRREHFTGWINQIVDEMGPDLGSRIRIHGDFHLGQVLRGPSGDLAVIDFEGEPTRPLDERREKTSPLRDVAGMVRSFAYAGATLALEYANTLPPAVRELRAARWERDLRTAFLDAYLAPGDNRRVNPLPANANDTRRLLELFEAEKAFYELAYELNNRPSWAWIPMRGISKLFVR